MKGKSKIAKAIEFSFLLIVSLCLVLMLLKKLSTETTEVTGILTKYECGFWKNSKIIHTHSVSLKSGQSYFVRTKKIPCSEVKAPKINRLVTLTVEGKRLLGLNQFNNELISNKFLAEESEQGASIIWLLAVVFCSCTCWSGYQFYSRLKI